MTSNSIGDSDEWTQAWLEFQSRLPVKLREIDSKGHCRAMIEFLNQVIDEIGDKEIDTLVGLLDVLTVLVENYEERTIRIPEASPSATLRFLMKQHHLRQADLVSALGSPSNITHVLTGKRHINDDQAGALAQRFGVSAAVFLSMPRERFEVL